MAEAEPEPGWIHGAQWTYEEIVLDGELVRYQKALHNQSNTVAVKVISGQAGAPVLSLGTLGRFFNYLSETPEFTSPGKKLELFISGRGVVALPENISVLRNHLRRLEVSFTSITSRGFPGEMRDLQELRRVVIDHNPRLEAIPEFIQDYIDGRVVFPHLLDIVAENTNIPDRYVEDMYAVLGDMEEMRAEAAAAAAENDIIGGRRRKSHRKSHRKSPRKTKKHSPNKTPNTPSKKRPNKNPRKSRKHNLKRRVSRNR
jgi:hypothetical protein